MTSYTGKSEFSLKKITDKLFGGLDMSWRNVIIFAVCAAVVVVMFLVVPIFKETSFHRTGETLEVWIFFAIIIMTNCKTPLESAKKTFVFFLISQPLIYLLQVPFSYMGWGLFQFYRFWFVLTLLTFPAAYIGWYIKKRNWLSLVILSPMLCLLTYFYVDGIQTTARNFPRMLVMIVFCLAQIVLYLYAFTTKKLQKILGFAVPLAIIITILLLTPSVDVNSIMYLPDDPVLTENAYVVTAEDTDKINISIVNTDQGSMLRVQTKEFVSTEFEVIDGDNVYKYVIEIYEDKDRNPRMNITPVE